jgi:hypothetical protein
MPSTSGSTAPLAEEIKKTIVSWILTVYSNGIVSVFGAKGREIESRRGKRWYFLLLKNDCLMDYVMADDVTCI